MGRLIKVKEVTLKIRGKQTNNEGEQNTIELITEGKFYEKNGIYYLIYNESEISGMEGATTTLKVEKERVSMKRFGNGSSRLIFEKGKKHKTEYQTLYGEMEMEVTTKKLDVNINNTGKGSINLLYNLNISNQIQSKNELMIEIL